VSDQVFQPGDKVMRVSGNRPDGVVMKYERTCPQYGQVYCVEDFWRGPRFNVVMLVGFGGWRYDSHGRKVGWVASAFRKVEEIKLCVEAVRKVPKPLEEVPADDPTGR
jgi:hypothetical protein